MLYCGWNVLMVDPFQTKHSTALYLVVDKARAEHLLVQLSEQDPPLSARSLITEIQEAALTHHIYK